MLSIIARLYWTIYSKLPGLGWQKQYAVFMKKNVTNKAKLQTQIKLFTEILKEVDDKAKNSLYVKWKTLDFLLCRFFLGALADSNYFYFGFNKYRWNIRNHFVTNDRVRFADRYLNTKEARIICKDKAKTAAHWQEWFRREWMLKEPGQIITESELKKLARKNGKCIVKPLNSYGGYGIFTIDPTEKDYSEKLEMLNTEDASYIIESYVNQTGFMHELNKSSVNTIRVVTARHSDGSIECLSSIVRVGHEGAIVDNASSGGVTYEVDIETGKILTGSDYKGRLYTTHPDSGIQITGLQIPRWNEVLEFCYSAHRQGPQGLGLVGWDVCLSEDDIVMIEANNCPITVTGRPLEVDLWSRMKAVFDDRYRNSAKK